MYLSVYFFIVYIDSTACVDLVYFCLFDMINDLMACMKPTLHICNIHQCTIENNVCVSSCYPLGLPPSWQLRCMRKGLCWRCFEVLHSLWSIVCFCKEENPLRVVGVHEIFFN